MYEKAIETPHFQIVALAGKRRIIAVDVSSAAYSPDITPKAGPAISDRHAPEKRRRHPVERSTLSAV
jgi:hypothetical protein